MSVFDEGLEMLKTAKLGSFDGYYCLGKNKNHIWRKYLKINKSERKLIEKR